MAVYGGGGLYRITKKYPEWELPHFLTEMGDYMCVYIYIVCGCLGYRFWIESGLQVIHVLLDIFFFII